MSYRIASFNMYNFSLRSDSTIKKNLDTIAKIIKDNNIDIVAMQEVLAAGRPLMGISLKKDAGRLPYEKSLLYRLGKDWECCWKSAETSSKYYPYLGGDERGEGYAFLWNTKKFELLKDEKGNEIFPTIYRNYHVQSGQLRLIRDPLYGRFKIKGTKTELRLVTTHIIYGKPKEENIKEGYTVDKGAIGLRQNEFNILAGNIYSRINQYRKDTNSTDPYTIVLGDYNLKLAPREITTSATIPVKVCFNASGERVECITEEKCIYTYQQEKSSLGESDYANNYDHFSFNNKVKNLVTEVKRVDGVGQYTNRSGTPEERFAEFKKEVSDHVPIILEIDLRKKKNKEEQL